MRLDKWLVSHGYLTSRQQAQQAILSGWVRLNGSVVCRCAAPVRPGDEVAVVHQLRYVSRGGYKLEQALRQWRISLHQAVVFDVGASTGGFTHCALQQGAAHVVAVDVGTDQLHPSLRHHPKVSVFEQTDIRRWEPPQGLKADWILADLSFISLTKVIPVFAKLIRPEGSLLALIKPQFEMEEKRYWKKGLVTSAASQQQAVEQVKVAADKGGWHFIDLVEINSEDRTRNTEFFAWFQFKGR